MANYFVNNPVDVVKVGQQVQVKVIAIDLEREKVSLSMKDDSAPRNQGQGIRNQGQGIRNQESGTRDKESGIRNQGTENKESDVGESTMKGNISFS